jgi:hypothetical protein
MTPRETRMPFHVPPSPEANPHLQDFRPRTREAVGGASNAFTARHVAESDILTPKGRESMAPGACRTVNDPVETSEEHGKNSQLGVTVLVGGAYEEYLQHTSGGCPK